MKDDLRIAAIICLCCIIIAGSPGSCDNIKVSANPQHPLVCIDPGHPSTTSSGRTVQNGVREVDINWQMALKLQSTLQKNYGIKSVKTREAAYKVMANEDRARFANRTGSLFVIRLHCDTGKSSGFAVYYPDRQGEHDGRTGPSPDIIRSSRTAAKALHKGMAKVLRGAVADRGIKGESRTLIGSRQGALTASIFSEIPAVTVEMVFLSNKSDARFIKSKKGQEKMARALAEGIVNYLQSAE